MSQTENASSTETSNEDAASPLNPTASDSVFAEDSAAKSSDTVTAAEAIQQLALQVAELRDRELKAQAELENFRRRMLRDLETQLKYASMPFVRDLLDVVDNLHRATDSAASSTSADGVVAGVKLVQQQLSQVLAKHHCTPIPGVGSPFDPNVHQAIAQQPSDEHPAGTVLLETSVGYMMHDRVVRPSMVIVSTGPVA